jgi:hypothetical protein
MRVFRPKTIGIVFLFVILTTSLSGTVLADGADAQAALSSARTALINCYAAAENAEAAGTNITSFVQTLNHANSLLTDAYVANTNQDYDSAYNLAVQSQTSLSEFLSQLGTVKADTISKENRTFLIAELSLIGAVAVLAVGVAFWVYLGKNKNSHRRSS